MTYYLMNYNDDSILEASQQRPADLRKEAEYFNCPVYLMFGQCLGEVVYPPALEVFTGMVAPEPLPTPEEAIAKWFDFDGPGAGEAIRFIDGAPDYQSGGDGQLLENVY